ncbi:uncharacterized protein LOC143464869 isoform X2 [Clavelina lepadiformis]|uniref:LAGLIDADG homing endonuclease n=1 Tax=Clavelina lepadiformis TaxID=159417 RepID=A0ABP0EZE8_CLALP
MFVLGWHCGPQRNGIIAIVYGGGPAARKRDYLTTRSKSKPEHLLLYGLLFLVLALGSEEFKGIGGLRLFAQAKSLYRHRRQGAPLPGQGQLDFDKLDKMVRIVAITEKRGYRLCVVAKRPSVPVPVNDTFPVVTTCPEDDSSDDTILADKFLVTNEKRRKLIFSFTLPEEAKKNLQRMCEIFAKNYGKTPSKYARIRRLPP